MSTSDIVHLHFCGKCHGPLSSYAPEGLCAACLLESALAASESGPGPLLQFGDYELLAEIARGGMGVVYRARQLTLNRPVAVKMILAGRLATASEIARFRAEAETAAKLQHPGIVAIHETGEHEGCQYFSMDYVAGSTLAELVREGPLPAQRAARYARAVAEAIQYAHEQGVLHRDLKPSNVLVDDKDQPRVTDFGLAKWLEGKSDLTQTGEVLGSPSFMSPEQARGGDRQVGPASDIYSLGAVLYHLLTGRPPFAAETINATLRMLEEQEPVAPRLLNASVPRDLEIITLKCLEKEPGRRYLTAAALAEDLGRFLNNQPLLARAPSSVYRLQKLVTRHKLVFTAVGAVVLVLIGGLGLSTWRYYKEREAVARALKAEQMAKTQAEDARALLRFFDQKVLAAARPEGLDGGLGREVTLRRALEAAEPQIAVAFKDHPLVEAQIRSTLGATFSDLGNHESAIVQLQRCVAIAEEHLTKEAPERLRYLNNLALYYRSAGELEKSLPLYKQVLELRTKTLGLTNEFTIASMGSLGAALTELDRVPESIPLLEQALKLAVENLPPDHYQRVVLPQDLARAYREANREEEALPMFEAALKQAEIQFGAENPETFSYINDLAGSYWMANRLPEATALFEKVVALAELKLGPDHDKTLAGMANLASAYRDTGQLPKAIELYERAVKTSRTKLRADHPYTMMFMNNLAIAYYMDKRLEQALPLWEEALALQRKKHGDDGSETLTTLNNLAMGYRNAGRLQESLEYSKEAFERSKAKYGASHRLTRGCMSTRASALMDAGELAEALPLYESLHEMLISKYPADHPEVITSRSNVGLIYSELGRVPEEVMLAEENFEASKKSRGPSDPGTLREMGGLGIAYIHAQRYAEARKVLEELLRLQLARADQSNAPIAESQLILGEALVGLGEAEAAIPLLEGCHEAFKTSDPSSTACHKSALLLGRALLLQKQFSRSERLLLSGYEGMRGIVTPKKAHSRKRFLDQAGPWIVQLYETWAAAEPDPVRVKAVSEWKAKLQNL